MLNFKHLYLVSREQDDSLIDISVEGSNNVFIAI